jgi:Protein of unknown function (DUF3618)
MTDARVEAARIEVERSRAQLMDTAKVLQHRLQPGKVARDAWESAKVKGADLAEDAVDAVRKRPYAAGGVVAAIALFLAREPLKDLVGRLSDAMTSDDTDDKQPKPQRRSVSNESKAAARPRRSQRARASD